MEDTKKKLICNIISMAQDTGYKIGYEKLKDKSISELWCIQDRMKILCNNLVKS